MNATADGRCVSTAPLDLETIRRTAQEVIADGARIEQPDEIATIITLLRGVLELLIPEVETLTGRHPREHVPAICARACLGESRMRLRLGNGDTPAVRLSTAQRLARSALALADHYERLGEPS
ncbi:DUF6415 family natural product biosynthesis protein [Streptomyces tendae]|uniref:DUF6415 family natural product biosynthesis protein n=1 Tax=Streptomyces tendae TaxID=1932 RepID=UPI003D7410A1